MDPPETAEHDTTDRVAIVANPYSGSRENRRLVAALIEELRRRGLEGVPIWDRAALTAALHPSAARGFRCAVAAGGDGTVSLVVNQRPEIPLAVLPLGTENLFAAQFAFTHDPAALARAIAGGRTRTIDLGRAGEHLFSTVASAGFDADVAHRLAAWRVRGEHLRRVRRRSYARPVLAAALRYRYPMLGVEADGRRLRGACVLVFNLPRYGFGFELCPGAAPDDGLLDCVVLEHPGRLRLAGYTLSMVRGRHLDRPDVHCFRFRRIRITCDQPVPMEIDGEAAGFAPVDIEVLPGAMRVVEM